MKKWFKKKFAFLIGCMFVAVFIIIMNTIANYRMSEDTINRQFLERMSKEAERITYPELIEKLSRQEIDTIYYNTSMENMVATKKLNEERELTPEDCYVTYYPAGDDFRTVMLSFGVNLVLCRNANTSSIITAVISGVFSIVPLVLIIWFYTKMLKVGGEDIKKDDILQKSNVKLDDIIGLDELRDELNIIINLIKNPEAGKKLDAEVPHGILLSGPAGVGKTMIAKGISNAADVPFISMNGSDFVEIYVGNGARRVRQLFKIARENAPCIIFIDEFDAIGGKRDSYATTSEDTKTINALLKEMDGFTKLENVFVIAATNLPEKLDPSIKRSGRFDREIKVNPPKDYQIRMLMFQSYLKNKPLAEDVNIELLSKQVVGFTGADIAAVCNEAALVAISKDLQYITQDCLTEAIDKKIFKGSYSKDKAHEPDRRIVAYHEAGHAVMTMLCGQKVSRASIKNTTSGVGGVVFGQDNDSQFMTIDDMISKVKIAYAGRASEQIKFISVTTGASNDIEQATDMLVKYVGRYGMTREIGLLSLDILADNGIGSEVKVFEVITEMANKLYDETYDLLTANFKKVEKLANKLLEVEVMSEEDVDELLKD